MRDYKNLTPKPISAQDAKRLVVLHHYMKTFPKGSLLHFGLFDGADIAGVCVFGRSTATDSKVQKLVSGLARNEYIEMQRLWISDEYGHNTESFCLARIIDLIKQRTAIKLIITHAGGCKNDCGIVYQSSAWLYFGKQPCRDFYKTQRGEYKNIVAALRFGRITTKGRTPQQIGEQLFGPGEMLETARYTYLYPIHKGLRRRLEKKALPYPKDSEVFRRDQQWVCNE